jgi:dihydrolipoamide dehydrogenase
MSDARKILVLGGGPAGYVAALRAAQLGAAVSLVEARQVGGTCLNRGCIPTKSLVASVERLRHARDSAAFGVLADGVGVDFAAMMTRKAAATTQLRGGVEQLLKARKVEVVAGRGRLLGPDRIEVILDTGEVRPPADPAAPEPDRGVVATRELTGDAVILATGSEPVRLPVFDFSDPRITTSDELLEIDHVPESLVVVGGGVIGCEFAAVFAELGTKVTVVEMLDQLLPGEERRVGVALLQAFKKAGIEVRVKTRVEETIAAPGSSRTVGDDVALRLSDGSEVCGKVVLVGVGRRPLTRGMGFEEAGVGIDERGFVVVDETLRTAVDGVFAAGDVAGPPLLAHWAYHEGAVAADNAVTGGRRAVDRRIVPNCVFTHPEVASFGINEEVAKTEGLEVTVSQVRLKGNSKAVVEGESDGFVRIVSARDSGVILGASLVGLHVTELVHELALAARAGLTLDDLAATIHAHPTLSEAIAEAALSGLGRGLHTL